MFGRSLDGRGDRRVVAAAHGAFALEAFMNPEHVRGHLRLLRGGGRAGLMAQPGWEAAQSSWASDIPDASTTSVHVPGLTEMPVQFDEGPPWRSKSFHVPSWYRGSDKRRVALLRRYTKEYGRDARLRSFVVKHVLTPAGVTFPSRQFKAQAAAILSWVQKNVAYVNEPGELLQSPWQTLKVAHGDCDDGAMLIAAMAESIGLGNRFVLGGKTAGGSPTRWHEGQKGPASGSKFFHIFCDLGWPALKPTKWMSAESTMVVPLGHDVTQHGVPAHIARGHDVAGYGGSNLGAYLVMGDPLGALVDHLPASADVKKYAKDILKLALVGATAQLLLLFFLKSRFGKRLKKWASK